MSCKSSIGSKGCDTLLNKGPEPYNLLYGTGGQDTLKMEDVVLEGCELS